MSQGISDCCISGHLHDGKPEGTVLEINGLKTYVAAPKDGSKDKTLIFIADIFGYQLPNAQILADEYAKAGFYVYLPDFFDGEVVPHEFLQKMLPTKAQAEKKTEAQKVADQAAVIESVPPFLQKHNEEVVYPLMQSYVNYLRSDPAHKKIGAVGFCFGGRYSILLAHEDANPFVDAAVANHPSFLKMPEEIEKIGKPVSIHVGDADDIMTMQDIETTKEIFKNKPFCEITVYEDQVHGFTIRADLSIEKDKKAKELAAEGAIHFLAKHLS